MNKKTKSSKLAEYISGNYSVCMTCERLMDKRQNNELVTKRLGRFLMRKILVEGVEMSHGACQPCDQKIRKEAEEARGMRAKEDKEQDRPFAEKEGEMQEEETRIAKHISETYAICAVCEELYWRKLDGEKVAGPLRDSLWKRIRKMEMRLSHGACQDCAPAWYGEIEDY